MESRSPQEPLLQGCITEILRPKEMGLKIHTDPFAPQFGRTIPSWSPVSSQLMEIGKEIPIEGEYLEISVPLLWFPINSLIFIQILDAQDNAGCTELFK